MLLVLSNKGKGMQSLSEQPLVGEDRCVTTLITSAKGTSGQTHEFILYVMHQRARADDLTICYCKKRVDVGIQWIHSAIALWIHQQLF